MKNNIKERMFNCFLNYISEIRSELMFRDLLGCYFELIFARAIYLNQIKASLENILGTIIQNIK